MTTKAKKKQPSTIAATLSALTWRDALNFVGMASTVVAAIAPIADQKGFELSPGRSFVLLLSIVALRAIEAWISRYVEQDTAPDDARHIANVEAENHDLRKENEALKAARRDTLPAGYATERAQATEGGRDDEAPPTTQRSAEAS